MIRISLMRIEKLRAAGKNRTRRLDLPAGIAERFGIKSSRSNPFWR